MPSPSTAVGALGASGLLRITKVILALVWRAGSPVASLIV
ncbi:hypothetical protein [Cryobacterium sp. TMT4-31]